MHFPQPCFVDVLILSHPTEEKRPKVKKPKFEFPVYEPSLTVADSANSLAYDQGMSIEEIENQLDDWLEDKKSQKKKVGPQYFPSVERFVPMTLVKLCFFNSAKYWIIKFVLFAICRYSWTVTRI